MNTNGVIARITAKLSQIEKSQRKKKKRPTIYGHRHRNLIGHSHPVPIDLFRPFHRTARDTKTEGERENVLMKIIPVRLFVECFRSKD